MHRALDPRERLRLTIEVSRAALRFAHGRRVSTAEPPASLPHLRAMKRASERPRDAVDLAELDELHGPG